MRRLNITLSILSVLFFGVVVFEVWVLYGSSLQSKTPSPTREESVFVEKDWKALNQSLVKNASFITKNTLEEAVLTTAYKGTITAIENEEKTTPKSKLTYHLSITFADKEGETNNVIFHQSHLDRLRVMETKGNEGKEIISYHDLIPGDLVQIRILTDLTKSWERSLLEGSIITRINL